MTRLFAVALTLAASAAFAQTYVATVEWDAVDDSRVGKYVIGVGSQTGVYPNEVTVEETQLTADIPDYGYDTYYIVARACKDDFSLCSEWTDEISYTHTMGAPANLRLAVQQLQGAAQQLNDAVAGLAAVVDAM